MEADGTHLDGDEVLQSDVLLHQELLSFGDKAHGSQEDLLVLCQIFLILRVRYCDWDLFLWKEKERQKLGVFQRNPRGGREGSIPYHKPKTGIIIVSSQVMKPKAQRG